MQLRIHPRQVSNGGESRHTGVVVDPPTIGMDASVVGVADALVPALRSAVMNSDRCYRLSPRDPSGSQPKIFVVPRVRATAPDTTTSHPSLTHPTEGGIAVHPYLASSSADTAVRTSERTKDLVPQILKQHDPRNSLEEGCCGDR